MVRRFVNWFPLGMTYAFLYMARYNLNVSKNAMGTMMSKEDFGIIFGIGTAAYGFSFLINGPLVDKWGGKKGIIVSALGACLINIVMGVVTYLYVKGQISGNIVATYSFLYALNMYFQSFGATSIIKVKAYWFHVRERGLFGAIFGTLISLGVYFAFDWGQAIADAVKLAGVPDMSYTQQMIRFLFAIDTGTHDAIWLVFFIPAFLLIFWALLDMFLLKDTPALANFAEFDPHDASSGGAHDLPMTGLQMLKKIFTSKIMITICFIEFCTGVMRNGILQWYFIFAHEVPQAGAEFFQQNWGLLLCISGIVGGFSAGLISDKLFGSRRGPPAALMNGLLFCLLIAMSILLMRSPIAVGLIAIIISAAVIGVHSIMSGTAAADFGGRKMTGTASGIADGFVYLGSGIQSVSIGYLVKDGDWTWWPIFIAPFALLGLILSFRMWTLLPDATKKYFESQKKA